MPMKIWIASIGAIMLAGCDKPEVKACEGFIKDSLASPTSYSRVEITRWTEPISKEEIDKLRQPLSGFEHDQPSLSLVGIQYDAQNAYGVKIRQGAICAFELDNGRPDDEVIVASKARWSATQVSLRRLIDAGAIEGTRPGSLGKPKKYDCCL